MAAGIGLLALLSIGGLILIFVYPIYTIIDIIKAIVRSENTGEKIFNLVLAIGAAVYAIIMWVYFFKTI